MDGGDDVMVILCCKCKVIFLSVGIFGAKRPQQIITPSVFPFVRLDVPCHMYEYKG